MWDPSRPLSTPPRSPRVAPDPTVVEEPQLGEAFDLLFVNEKKEEEDKDKEDKTSVVDRSRLSSSDSNRADSAANQMDGDDDSEQKTLHQARFF